MVKRRTLRADEGLTKSNNGVQLYV
jgi:hypothetical protein